MRCEATEHDRVFNGEYWICRKCSICGSEQDPKKQIPADAAEYQSLLKAKHAKETRR